MKNLIILLVSSLFIASTQVKANDISYSYYFYGVNEAASFSVDGQYTSGGSQVAIHNGSQVSAQYSFGCVPTTYATIGYLYVYDETVVPRKEIMEVEVRMYYGVEWDNWNITCVGDWIGYNVTSEYAPCR